MKYAHLPFAAKVIINTMIIIAFIAALFLGGMAVYAEIKGITFAAVWLQFIDAVRK